MKITLFVRMRLTQGEKTERGEMTVAGGIPPIVVPAKAGIYQTNLILFLTTKYYLSYVGCVECNSSHRLIIHSSIGRNPLFPIVILESLGQKNTGFPLLFKEG
jgi:hypothetical protein